MGNFRAEDYPRKFGKNSPGLKFFGIFFLKIITIIYPFAYNLLFSYMYTIYNP